MATPSPRRTGNSFLRNLAISAAIFTAFVVGWFFVMEDGADRIAGMFRQYQAGHQYQAPEVVDETDDGNADPNLAEAQTAEAELGDDEDVVRPDPRNRAERRRILEERYRARRGRDPDGEVLRSSEGERIDGGTRYTLRVSGIPRDSCLDRQRFRYTRMPRTITEGDIATLTRYIEQRICRPESGQAAIPLEGCVPFEEERLCYRAVRKSEPAPPPRLPQHGDPVPV